MLRRVVVGSAAVSAVGVVALGQLLAAGDRDVEDIGLVAGIAVPFTVLGGLVLASLPRHRVGRTMTAAGLVATVELVALSWADWTPLAWLAQWMWWPSLGLVFLAVLVFPTGALPSPRWRPVAWLVVAGTAVGAILLAVAAIDQPRMLTVYGSPREPWADLVVVMSRLVGLLTLAGYLGAVLSLVARWLRADSETRRQLACLIPGAIALLLGLALSSYAVPGAWALIACGIPLGMAVAILRYRLYDVDLIVNRTIVWLLLTALVLLAVAAIVKILSDVVFSVAEDTAALMATGLVVVTIEPLHRRVQHSVDHLIYGDRDDPYLVIARLGGVLRRTVDPTAVMPLVTETIATSLQVPYVGVELQERAGPVLVTEHGRPVEVTESFDMVSHGERLGRLIVGRRSTGARFSRYERRLLQDIAVQAGLAAEATQLNRDLQASRERLVAGREEERRRLRRDLHDGLGPAFAGMTMQARAALEEASPPGGRLERILTDLADDLESCRAEVRQLVDELRPPALDSGLQEALRAECARFDTDILSTSCEIEGSLDGLPAAVEVAAFRIVAEALTNVTRHSAAETCRVTVRRNGALRVEVIDDGTGITPSSVHAGVGLSSMRERAAELGGSCAISQRPDGGTSVRLELPLGHARLTPHPSDTPDRGRSSTHRQPGANPDEPAGAAVATGQGALHDRGGAAHPREG
jgi:signal transduction histidine kinase